MNPERKTYDYRIKDWKPRIRWYDWFPVVGLVTMCRREHIDLGFGLSEVRSTLVQLFHKETRSEAIRSIASLGTSKWPEPIDKAADIRSGLLGVRNATFVADHFLSTFAILIRVLHI